MKTEMKKQSPGLSECCGAEIVYLKYWIRIEKDRSGLHFYPEWRDGVCCEKCGRDVCGPMVKKMKTLPMPSFKFPLPRGMQFICISMGRIETVVASSSQMVILKRENGLHVSAYEDTLNRDMIHYGELVKVIYKGRKIHRWNQKK